MLLLPVFADKIPDVWHQVKPLVEKALARTAGEQEPSDVLSRLLSKSYVLFAGIEGQDLSAICIAEILYYPRKKICHVTLAATKSGRDFEDWEEHFKVIEDFARAMGCVSVSAWVRKGFVKKLKWKHQYSIVTKDL
tara:strand:- start:188 stop:595 length:408 start_codon:yes stop_codon:yes gene_type:complete